MRYRGIYAFIYVRFARAAYENSVTIIARSPLAIRDGASRQRLAFDELID